MIYLVRHGQTDWNIEHRIQGQTDVPLNATGRAQAVELSEKLSSFNIQKIISSDLSRAKETAEIIKRKLNVPMSLDRRLREYNYGLIEGKVRDSLPQGLWDLYQTNPHKIKAEAMIDIFNRVKSFFDDLAEEKQNILASMHGGIIRMALYYVRHSDKVFVQDDFKRLYIPMKIGNTQVFSIDL